MQNVSVFLIWMVAFSYSRDRSVVRFSSAPVYANTIAHYFGLLLYISVSYVSTTLSFSLYSSLPTLPFTLPFSSAFLLPDFRQQHSRCFMKCDCIKTPKASEGIICS